MCVNSTKSLVCLALAIFSQVPSPFPTFDFIAPAPLFVKESLFPANSVASGPVHLVVRVNRRGKVTNVNMLRSIPSLDDASIKAAGLWTFVPAKLDGQPRDSFFTISFNYYILGLNSTGKVLPFTPGNTGENSDIPPIPVITRQPKYPDNSVAIGSVILLVDLEVDGKVSKARVLRSLAPLDELCMEAARKWRYDPAKLNRQPIQARAAICFNFDRGSGQVGSTF